MINNAITIIAAVLMTLSAFATWLALSAKQHGGTVTLNGEMINIGCLGCMALWMATFSVLCALVALHPQWITGL